MVRKKVLATVAMAVATVGAGSVFMGLSDGGNKDLTKTGYDNQIVSEQTDEVSVSDGNVRIDEVSVSDGNATIDESVMNVNEKESYYAVKLYNYADAFKIVSDGKVLLSFDNIEQKVEGAEKVTTDEENWQTAYLTPANSYEIEFKDGFYGSLCFFADGKEYNITTYDVKKIAFAEDGSVEFYRKKNSELFPWVAISASDNMKLEAANGESATVGQNMENGFELFNDYYDDMNIDTVRHETSEYVKCTPAEDSSTVEMTVNFAVGGIEITSSMDENAYLYELDDGAKKLVIEDRIYDIDMEIDTYYCAFDIYGTDYDQDGQKDYLLEATCDEEVQGKGLYLIKLNEDQTAELTKIDNVNSIQ